MLSSSHSEEGRDEVFQAQAEFSCTLAKGEFCGSFHGHTGSQGLIIAKKTNVSVCTLVSSIHIFPVGLFSRLRSWVNFPACAF